MQFSLCLQQSISNITQVEILEPVHQVSAPDFIRDCNPSVQILSDNEQILSVSDMMNRLNDLTMHTLDSTQIDELEPPPCLFPDVPIGKKKRFFPTDSLDSTNVSFQDQRSELQISLNDPNTFEPDLISPALSDRVLPAEQLPVTPRPQRAAKTAANAGILLSVRPKRKSRRCSSPRENNTKQ